jgi:hypothetical protein
MLITFYYPLLLWSFVLLGSKVSAIELPHGPPSPKGQLRGEPASVNQPDDKGLASNLQKVVLKDQLGVTLELSKNYVFLGFEPGMLVENICNGGGQYVNNSIHTLNGLTQSF